MKPIILKKLKEKGAKWEITTEEDCLKSTEGAGYWKIGTVLSMLRQGQEVFTPTALYRAIWPQVNN